VGYIDRRQGDLISLIGLKIKRDIQTDGQAQTDTDVYKDRQQGALISLHLFFQRKESKEKMHEEKLVTWIDPFIYFLLFETAYLKIVLFYFYKYSVSN
jgi:hypothetical protein